MRHPNFSKPHSSGAGTDPCIKSEPRARICEIPVIQKSRVSIKEGQSAYFRNLLYVNGTPNLETNKPGSTDISNKSFISKYYQT